MSMASKRGTTKSKAGYVYVLSNDAMPGIVKIGMTQRHPDARLKEINSATGVLPFRIEAVISSSNAKWTERAVHERLSGKRVNDRREFFRTEVSEAEKIIRAVASEQRQTAYDRKAWNGGAPIIGGTLMAMLMLPVIAILDFRIALPWALLCLFIMVSKRRGSINEFLSISRRFPFEVLLVLAFTAAAWTAWHQGVTDGQVRAVTDWLAGLL